MYYVKKEHAGCEDDGTNTPETKTQSCMKVNAKPGANTFTVTVLIVLTVTAILVLCLWRVSKERNKLRIQYQRLSREASNVNELQDVPSAAVGEEEDDEFNQPTGTSTQ
jgi:cytochrome oxidase assembly protein ShyY1